MSNKINRIKLLPLEVYSKIAAGEVIDRPASVVRELIDNSIDAKSTEINIYIERGGLSKIVVSDNGIGIDKDDLKLLFKKHATSKISTFDDIFKIDSMGFRGEALHSIHTVSKVILTTNSDPSGRKAGYKISNIKDNFNSIEEVPFKKGTKIEVSDIFYNMPARRKFLKSTISEWNHIKKCVILKALSHIDISFSLFHNGEKIFTTKGDNDFRGTFFAIFNENKFDISAYKKEQKDFSLTVYYSDPSVFFQNRKYMEIFVNKRSVNVPFFYSAVDSAYRKYLSPGRYPLLYLFLDISPQLIDVNIHPAKKEVKFLDQNAIFSFIYLTIGEALSCIIKRELILDEIPLEVNKQEKQLDIFFKETNYSYNNFKTQQSHASIKIEKAEKEYNPLPNKNYKILGTIFNTYILIEFDKKVVILDQHAASEAIIFKRKKRDSNINSEKLLIPILIDLDKIDSNIKEKIEYLNNNGFLIETQEGTTITIREMPSILLSKKDYDTSVEIVKNFLENINNYKNINLIDEILIQLSCREAVKKGDSLNLIEINEIVDEYFKEEIKNCPHGRPAHFELSKEYLDKLFQRKI